ncbi:MAG: radical SAM protein [Thermoplasmata archaeon]|nr:MAG: radical SAM protein [Thermoplasmata archaeon]
MVIRYEEKDFKSILNKHKFIDSWFWCRYGINVYQGCEHACTYCDSRSHRYHLHPEFDQVIVVKNNVAEMLDNRLSRARTLLPDVVVMSGMSDPYHPAEKKFESTKKCLEILEKHRYPVHIITKSPLVTRDKNILARIGKNNWCSVSFTITTTDQSLAKFLEPGAPPPKARLKAITELKKAGDIHVGVTFIPIVPFLADSDEALESVTRAAKEAGADYILFGGGMTMRDAQAKWYFKRLGEQYPELVEKYLELFQAEFINGEYKGRYVPVRKYAKKLYRKMFELCEKYDIKYRMKRYIPDDYRKDNYIVAEEFVNEAYVQQSSGKPYSNIFWAGQNITNLKESIRAVAHRGELRQIRNVDEEIEIRIINRLDTIKEGQMTLDSC